MSEQEWLEDELMEVMRVVGAPRGNEDSIIMAIKLTAIRRLMESDTERYEALLARWQARHEQSEPQKEPS